jgi:hypothetical protein
MMVFENMVINGMNRRRDSDRRMERTKKLNTEQLLNL